MIGNFLLEVGFLLKDIERTESHHSYARLESMSLVIRQFVPHFYGNSISVQDDRVFACRLSRVAANDFFMLSILLRVNPAFNQPLASWGYNLADLQIYK